MTKHKKKILLQILLIIGISVLNAQNSSFKKYLFEIDYKEEQFTGKGIDWILSKSDTTQFFLFGEQHGIKGIPELIGDIYEKLNRKSPFLLALEMDEWTTHKIFEKGIESVSAKNPYSVAFDYDSEFKLINKVNNTSEIWGLDQMVTAIHPFQRLVEIAPNENARCLAQGAFLKATLKMGEYLPQSHFEDFDALRTAFAENISTEANQILDHLKRSM